MSYICFVSIGLSLIKTWISSYLSRYVSTILMTCLNLIVQSHPGNFDPRAMNGQKQHRARQQLSCTACRAGKLKCNRQHPCDQCCKRAKEDGCLYLPPPAKKKQSKNTKDRIAQLEGLVVQLMNRVSLLLHVLQPASTSTSRA